MLYDKRVPEFGVNVSIFVLTSIGLFKQSSLFLFFANFLWDCLGVTEMGAENNHDFEEGALEVGMGKSNTDSLSIFYLCFLDDNGNKGYLISVC